MAGQVLVSSLAAGDATRIRLCARNAELEELAERRSEVGGEEGRVRGVGVDVPAGTAKDKGTAGQQKPVKTKHGRPQARAHVSNHAAKQPSGQSGTRTHIERHTTSAAHTTRINQ